VSARLDEPAGEADKRGMCRLLLACLIAVAVAVAPVGVASAKGAGMAKPAMEDCHGKTSSDAGPCCDAMAKDPDPCGVKCCKLIGTVASAPAIAAPAVEPPEALQPPAQPDRMLRPQPPPPRS